MRKLGIILFSIGVGMIIFGLGWIIGEEIINTHICNNTTNVSWYIENCMNK